MSYFRFLPTINFYQSATISSGDLIPNTVGNIKDISYGITLRDLFVKYKFRSSVLSNPQVFYPYRWKEEDRPDTVALNYYGDEDYWWVVFFSNDAFNLHYDFPLPYDQLLENMVRKYRDLYYATVTIVVDNLGSGNYTVDEVVSGPNDFYGVVESWTSGTRTLTLRRVQGVLPDVGDTITGLDSATARDIETIAMIGPETLTTSEKQDILASLQTEILYYTTTDGFIIDETAYLSGDYPGSAPVYVFDKELEDNEDKRNIRLLDKRYLGQLTDEFKNEVRVRRIRGR